MNTDFYTRAMLTIIAGALAWICVNDAISGAAAQTDAVQKVVVVGWDKPLRALPVLPVNEMGQALLDGASVRVVVANHETQPLPVDVAGIGRAARLPWEPIQVEVLKPPPARQPGHP